MRERRARSDAPHSRAGLDNFNCGLNVPLVDPVATTAREANSTEAPVLDPSLDGSGARSKLVSDLSNGESRVCWDLIIDMAIGHNVRMYG